MEKREIAFVRLIRPLTLNNSISQTIQIYFYHFYDMIRFINIAQLGDTIGIKFKIGDEFNCSGSNILIKAHKPLLSPLKNDFFRLDIILKNNCKNLFHDSIKNEIKKEFIYYIKLEEYHKYPYIYSDTIINLLKNLGIDIVYI